MELLEGIYSRRSTRHFKDKAVDKETLHEIIRAGTWAPSGLNNQPWRFITVSNISASGKDMLAGLAAMTKYERIIREAPACIVVLLDRDVMYDEVKDHQAVGACIQNMLLAAHDMGLGAVWLGEILNNAGKVTALMGLPAAMELMAVVALGYPSTPPRKQSRRDLPEVIIRDI